MSNDILLFIDDKSGSVATVFAASGKVCIAWHKTHEKDEPEMVITPQSGGVVLLIGGDLQDALSMLAEYVEMTKGTVVSIHSTSERANQYLPLLELVASLTNDDTLVIPWDRAA